MRIALLAITSFLLSVAVQAQEKRNLLTDFYTRKFVSESITRDNSWVPYPAYQDREAWQKIPEAIREQTIQAGEKYLGYEWPTITATMYLEFTRTGNRSVVDAAVQVRESILETLVLAELMEGKGRFLDDIINGVFVYCEQTYWGMSSTFYLYGFEGSIDNIITVLPDINDPVIDLKVGDIAADLAWTWYFFHEEFDKVSPIISERLKAEMQKKVLDPYYERYDLWWITGWGEGRVNNWNPWCNYNILTCILLMEDDPKKQEDGVYKTMASVDLFINSYPDDGGCSEGPSYWSHAGGKLFDYLNLLKQNTEGNIDLFDHNLIKNMGRYIYRAYIGNGNYYINFADAPLKINHNPGQIYRFGKAIEDQPMQSFGAFLLKEREYGNHAEIGRLGGTLENLFSLDNWKSIPADEPFIGEYYFPDLDVAIGREKKGSTAGFYFAAKGGSNGEQHNHNDVGSFMLYYNEHPVLIDVGVGTYTRQTFSKDRYKIWTMQSDYHNLPQINGSSQPPGGGYKAINSDFSTSNKKVTYSTDIAGAYPEEAKVKEWTRKYTLERSGKFVIEDDFQLSENQGNTNMHFMSGVPCEITEEGTIAFTGPDFTLQMKYNPAQLEANIEQVEITDPKLIRALGEEIARIVFTPKDNGLSGNMTFEMAAK